MLMLFKLVCFGVFEDRYTATTVLALLQEVAQSEGVKIDWNALVKKTSTGISNAREYQMLWRYLAYRHTLLETLEDGAQPLVIKHMCYMHTCLCSFFFFL